MATTKAATKLAVPPAFTPYVPATQSPAELTLKAVIIGALFGLLFGASTVYLGLRAGLTVSASIPIAVLAISVLKRLGGSTILEGMPELAESVLGMPVRRGTPKGVGGLLDVVRTPAYSTGVGLVLQATRSPDGELMFGREADKRGMWKRMRSWFGEVF